jgi:hypothetical protein
MKLHQKRFAGALLAVCLVLSAQEAPAQILYGGLIGNVTDATHASIPGATVTVVNQATQATRQSTTNESGAYSFPTLATGTYELSVSMDGFRTARRSGVVVPVNNTIRVDVAMELGEVTETVTVEASSLQLQTDRAEVRAQVTEESLQDLPIPPGRNYQSLLGTIPGFSPPSNAHSVPANPSRSLRFNVNGTSGSNNNTRIDGASSTNIWLPHMVGYIPSLDAIETVDVVTNSFDAEQGLAGGAAINVQIKSGTNEVHGSAFWFHNNNQTKAKPFFSPQGTQNPKNVFNQYGGTVGGPIVKNKLFYFASWEQNTDRQFASSIRDIPTAAMRNGDLSGSSRKIYDPATGGTAGVNRAAFENNIIPASRIDRSVALMTPLLPDPTFSGSQDNFFAAAPFKFDRDKIDTKINWNATDRFTMFGRYSYLDYRTINTQSFGAELGGNGVTGFSQPGTATGNSYSMTISGTYVASPTFVVDAYYGWTKMAGDSRPPRLDENIGLDILGIPGTNGTRFFEGGWPRFQIDNFEPIGVPNAFMPFLQDDPQFQYVANANWTKGSHSIRFGVDFYKQNINQTQPEFPGANHGAQGGFRFGQGQTRLGGSSPSPANEYNSWASFLLGVTSNAGKIHMVPDEFTTRTWFYSTYIRDQWQMSPRLTFNYGVRWEYFPIPTRADRGMETYDFETNEMLVCGVGSVPKDCGIEVGKWNFAPRLGLAYRVNDTFVIRTGYGITNDPYNLARPLRTNHPMLVALNLNAPNGFDPATQLQDGIPLIEDPDLGNGRISIPGQVAVNSLRIGNWDRGYIQSWNFTLEKEFGSWIATAGYVGTRSIGQLGYLDRNVAPVGGGNANKPYNLVFGRDALTRQVTTVGTQLYDSFQTRLRRQSAAGYQLQFAYTFSKNMGIAGNDNSDGEPRIHLPEFYHLNRARTTIDQTHNFQATGVVELPFGRGKKWATSGTGAAILGGWQLNTILSLYTGTPFSITASGGPLNAPGNDQRADLVKPEVEKIGGAGPDQPFYDPAAFADVRETRFGTAGWNLLDSPGTFNLDLGLFRNFTITERINMQFRAEAFNATNTPHFNAPQGSVTNSSFMEISGVRGTGREGIDERVFRFGLRMTF